MSTNQPDRPTPAPTKPRSSKNPLWVWIFLWSITILADLGFAFKLFEFTRAWASEGAANFAIVPVASYLAVAVGFLCIFIWSFNRGEYKDVERAKYRMLEMQDEIDARGGRA